MVTIELIQDSYIYIKLKDNSKNIILIIVGRTKNYEVILNKYEINYQDLISKGKNLTLNSSTLVQKSTRDKNGFAFGP